MIYSVIPYEMIFSDEQKQESRFIQQGNLFLELRQGTVNRIISTNPQDYLRCDRPEKFVYTDGKSML